MDKIALGKNCILFPMPMGLVGIKTDQKPNFTTVGSIASASLEPPMVSMSLNKARYASRFIKEKKVFSLNFPNVKSFAKTDYCGLVSGEKVDKSNIFEVFYGSLKDAPMIKECPLCMECQLVAMVNLPKNDVFIGEIINSYTEERFLTNGKPDTEKLGFFTLNFADSSYRGTGNRVGRAFSDGTKYASLK